MQNKVIAVAIGILVMAIILPIGLGNLATSGVGNTSETFTALNAASVTEDFQLSFFPVLDELSTPVQATTTVDNATVSLDEVANYLTTDGFTVVAATGLVRTSTDSVDVGDSVVIAYAYDRDFGDAEPLWDNLPILVIAGLIIFLLGFFGLMGKRKKGGDG